MHAFIDEYFQTILVHNLFQSLRKVIDNCLFTHTDGKSMTINKLEANKTSCNKLFHHKRLSRIISELSNLL